MMRFVFGWSLICFFFIVPAYSQVTNVTVASCAGQVICVAEKDSLFDLCVKVKIPAGHCKITRFTLKWGDGKAEEFTANLDYSKENEIEKHHLYYLGDFAKFCYSETDYNVEIRTENEGCSQAVDRNISPITLKNQPRAKFQIPDICEGKQVYFNNNSCPGSGNDMTYTWDFGDGTVSAGSSPGHIFPTTKNSYKVKLSAKNSCGVSEIEQEVRIRKVPEADLKASGFTISGADTLLCLENGGVVTLDGTVSKDQSRYEWNISGGSYKYLDNTHSGSAIAKVQLMEAGAYRITLTASNDCARSLPKTMIIKAILKPSLSIAHQPNSCQPIKYKIPSSHPDARYFLNGKPIQADAEIEIGLSPDPYIVSAEIPYACGVFRPKPDTFYVRTSLPLSLISPPKDTTLCASGARIPLRVSLTTGQWEGDKSLVESANGQLFFNPKTPGVYALRYVDGEGICRVETSVRITVAGVTAQASDLAVCEGTPAILLGGSPSGGTWTTSDCVNCIKGDSLLLGGVSATRLRLTYEVRGAGGCTARAAIAVDVSRPKAAFTLADGCSGTPMKPVNGSAGAGSYQWFVNGTAVSAEAQPSLTLPAGKVIVRLVASAGTCHQEATREIQVTNPPEKPRFSASVTAGCAPLTVSFTPQGAARTDVTYAWDFGDGTSASGFQASARVFRNQSSAPKNFLVTYSMKNTCGTLQDTLSIRVKPLVKADIGADSTVVRCSPALVKFSNRSLGVAGTSEWDFGDGTRPLVTTADTLSHLFSARDSLRTFRVSIKVKNECGEDKATVPIRVYPVSVKTLFTMSQSEVCPGVPVQFKDATVPLPTRWAWRFGEEGASLEQNPTFTFAKAESVYTISLIAYTPCGYDSTRKTLKTTALPKGNFRVDSVVCAGQPLRLLNTTDVGQPTLGGFTWDFGDGNRDSTRFSPEYTYTTPGTKVISLTLSGSPRSCAAPPVRKLVAVRPRPVAAFRMEEALCSSVPVQFRSESTGAAGYRWYLNGVLRSEGENPQIALSAGYYQVSLVAYTTCRDSVSGPVPIQVDTCWAGIPEAFTPDGRGPSTGERITVFGKGIDKVLEFRVINRWGNTVFEARDFVPNDMTLGWNGRDSQQNEMPEDMYRYEAVYRFGRTGDPIRKSGTFYLLRGRQ